MAGEGGPVEIRLSDCQCPSNPHANDLLWMRARADMNMGLAAQSALGQAGNYRGDNESALLAVMVRYGVVAWNLRDERGDPRPVSTDAVVERLGWSSDALMVMAKARELYWDTVLAPLVPTPSEPAPPMPSDDSTSQNPPSGPRTRTSSGPSSHSGQETPRPSATTGA